MMFVADEDESFMGRERFFSRLVLCVRWSLEMSDFIEKNAEKGRHRGGWTYRTRWVDLYHEVGGTYTTRWVDL